MKRRSSGSGKWWLVVLVVFGLALSYRLHERRGADRSPAPTPRAAPPTPATAPILPATTPVVPPTTATEPARPAEPYASNYWLHALSTDGKRALLVEGTDQSEAYPLGLRVVTIATGKVEAEVAFHAYGADHPDPTALADEMARARALLRGFPLGAGGTLATTADGTAGALSGRDAVMSVRGDRIGAKLHVLAAYSPMMLDADTMLVSAYHGRDSDGDGVYALGWASLDSPVVHEIEGTIDYEGAWAVSDAGDVLRVLARQAPGVHDCVVDLALVKPFRVIRKRCLDNTRSLEVKLSPHGTWVAWQTKLGDDAPTRLRTMNVDTGEVGIDVSQAPGDQLGPRGVMARGFMLVTDTGRVVVFDLDGNARAIDPETKAGSPVTDPHPGLDRCLPRGDRELVCENHGSVSVAKI